jgi:cytochrome c oxidase subunit 1
MAHDLAHDGHQGGHDAHHPYGWLRWIETTNHKDIGIMYLIFAITMLLIGGSMILAVRAELFQPGLQLMQPEFFNQLITLHGLIMVFGFAMPAATGLANYMLPMVLGAPDMALPRLNNWGFWILPPAALMLTLPFFLGIAGIGPGAVDTGWTMYAPLSVQSGWGMDFAIFAVHMLGVSSILGAINVIVTILNMRAPGMTLMKMPLFAHGFLMTAVLLIVIMPVLAGGVTMVLMDRHFGTHFFSASGGGDPVLWQHIFWFMGHPEVYVLLLPITGAVPHVLSAFLAQANIWLPCSGLLHVGHCRSVGHRLGTPHVHQRHVHRWSAVLHVQHHADFAATGRDVLLLDCHHLARLTQLRDTHAVCRRLHHPVWLGWLDWPRAGRCRS